MLLQSETITPTAGRLYVIAKNKLIDEKRHRKKLQHIRRVADEADEAITAPELIDDGMEGTVLTEIEKKLLLSHLSVKHAEVMALKFDGFRDAHIGERLGISVNTVKKRLKEARVILRKMYKR